MIALSVKVVGAAIAAAVATGMTGQPMCCPSEVISCIDGVPSFSQAHCTETNFVVNGNHFELETLICPTGEIAMSGGFRLLVLHDINQPMLTSAPFVPKGPNAIGYQYVWRQHAGAPLEEWKVYVTCQT